MLKFLHSLLNWLNQITVTILVLLTEPRTHSSSLVYPSDLIVTETYNYSAKLSSIVSKELLGDSPSGRVEIIIPADEWRKLPHRENIEDSLILIHQYQRTDLDARLKDYEISGDFFPLQQIINDTFFNHVTLDNNGQLAHQIRIPYSPEKPWEPLINIDIKIYDEVTLNDALSTEEEQQRYYRFQEKQIPKNFSTRQIIEQILKRAGFINALIFELSFQLVLPTRVCSPLITPPFLKTMSLVWPTTTSHQQINLEIENKTHPITFDPISHSIIWQDVAFEQSSSYGDNNRVFFNTPSMILTINEPVELFRDSFSEDALIWKDNLPGEIIVEVPCLLSGLQFVFGDNSLAKSESINLKMQTVIQIKFNLFIENLFARRKFSPYQRLQFPDVILSDMRLADIVLLLEDIGFKVDKDPKKELELKDKRIIRHLITAHRQQEGKLFTLWMVIEGTVSNTTREKEIPGDEKYQTSIATGNTVIYIRGQIEEDMQRVVETINLIHTQLKDRFQHVSTIN